MLCPKCKTKIYSSEKICPNCNANLQKKPLYKKWWFWLIIGVLILGVVGGSQASPDLEDSSSVDSAEPVPVTPENCTHDYDFKSFGKCSICGNEVKKQSPIKINDITEEQDFLDGVSWTFNITNTSDKAIKYIDLAMRCYNAVGDEIYSDLSWDKNLHRVTFTGPLESNTSENYVSENKFYNENYDTMNIVEVKVTYFDDSVETITKYHEGLY